MEIYQNQGETFLTTRAIEKRAAKLHRRYKKRMRKHEGRKPKKELFIIAAAYFLFKEKYPKRKTGLTQLADWLQGEYKNSTYDFDINKLYKWKGRKSFKEMQWEGAWEDLRIAQKISDRGAKEGEMSQRDIMWTHSISKQELEILAPWILSHHAGNEKAVDKFIFNRSEK